MPYSSAFICRSATPGSTHIDLMFFVVSCASGDAEQAGRRQARDITTVGIVASLAISPPRSRCCASSPARRSQQTNGVTRRAAGARSTSAFGAQPVCSLCWDPQAASPPRSRLLRGKVCHYRLRAARALTMASACHVLLVWGRGAGPPRQRRQEGQRSSPNLNESPGQRGSCSWRSTTARSEQFFRRNGPWCHAPPSRSVRAPVRTITGTCCPSDMRFTLPSL
jgi:hypothetical protein